VGLIDNYRNKGKPEQVAQPVDNNKQNQSAGTKLKKFHDQQTAYSRPPQQEEGIESTGNNASSEGTVGQILTLGHYLCSGAKHTDTQPDNHTTAEYAEYKLNYAVVKEMGETEIYQ